ncbi:MAG: GNAT family N-acetyltransferase [Stellaceae bacterium]
MSEGFAVEPLRAGHNRTEFSCGSDPLDRYLRELATQDMRRRISNCFVALDSARVIAGYYTFAATAIPVSELLSEETRHLPRYPVLPAGLIGRLAVDQRYRGRGLGGTLLVDAIVRAIRAEPAIFALVVDAKDDPALSFYRHHGFRPFASRPLTLYLPMAEAARRLAAVR